MSTKSNRLTPNSKNSVSRTRVLIVKQTCIACIKKDGRLTKKFYSTRWSIVEHIIRNHKGDYDSLIQLQKLGYIPKNWVCEE